MLMTSGRIQAMLGTDCQWTHAGCPLSFWGSPRNLLSLLVAGACNAPKPADLPFRYRLSVKRRIPLILPPPNPTSLFEPPALEFNLFRGEATTRCSVHCPRRCAACTFLPEPQRDTSVRPWERCSRVRKRIRLRVATLPRRGAQVGSCVSEVLAACLGHAGSHVAEP
jgi:hypothetical protein